MTLTTVPNDLDNIALSIEGTQKLSQMLMNTKHYAKIGSEGIFAIVAKARSLAIDPLDAINGGLYCVQGKVEMSSQMMNQLIRQAGHSITKDTKSDDSVCILHGKRADTGDTWTESFSIADARRAGIFKEGGSWTKYPRDMLFARALSRLARQLFPDVIKGCYVEGEIAQSIESQNLQVVQVEPERINAEQVEILNAAFDELPEYKETVMSFFAKKGITTVDGILSVDYDRIIMGSKKAFERKLSQMQSLEQQVVVNE
jgi:hypothetical protein